MLGQVNGKIFFIESILTWFFSMYMFIEFSEDLIISWGVYIVVILNKKIKYTYHSVFFGFLYILCDIIRKKKTQNIVDTPPTPLDSRMYWAIEYLPYSIKRRAERTVSVHIYIYIDVTLISNFTLNFQKVGGGQLHVNSLFYIVN